MELTKDNFQQVLKDYCGINLTRATIYDVHNPLTEKNVGTRLHRNHSVKVKKKVGDNCELLF